MRKQGMENSMKKMAERRAKKARSGFTLVELIVVLALIGLLAAVSAGGMLGYSMYSTYKRNNDSAKTIFSAAQSAITYYKASGKLDGFRRKVEALPQNPAFVPKEAFEGAEAGGSGSRSMDDTISYLMISNDSYDEIEKAVQDGDLTLATTSLDEQTKLLFQLLSDYVTDVSIYNASICVEFDATDGVVSGVLYSSKDQSFSYGEGADTIDITQRDESYRRRVGLGYYSTELSERAPEKVENLEIAGVRMVNAESLDVEWFLEEKYQYLKGAQDYKIELYEKTAADADDTEGKLVAEIYLEAANVGLITRENGGQPYVDAQSVILHNPADPDQTYNLTTTGSGAGGPVRFHAFLAQDEKYGSGIALSLDAMDSGAVEALAETDGSARQTALLSTYSAQRLSYDGGDVHYGLSLDDLAKVSAKVFVAKNTGDSGKTTDPANLLFADVRKDESGTGIEYEIANARHLYNINFSKQNVAGATAAATYRITRDFAWGGPEGLLSQQSVTTESTEGGEEPAAEPGSQTTRQTTKYFVNQTPYSYSEAQDGGRTQYPPFPGITVLNANSTLTGEMSEEEAKELEEKAEKSEDGEEEEPKTDLRRTIAYLTLEPQKGTDGSCGKTGLVRENNGTITDLRLENVDVRGVVSSGSEYASGEYAGAFCGLNNGTLTDLETVSGYVTGGRNVGGILGSTTTKTISGLKNGAEVCGIENVGGIIGVLQSGQSITGAQNTGLVYGWNLPAGASTITRWDSGVASGSGSASAAAAKYIGGIAGYVSESATLADCISNPVPQRNADGSAAVLTAEEVQTKLYGSYVGGVAGYLAGSATITNCATGTDGSASYVLGENFVGGIIGGFDNGNLTTLPEKNNSNGATVIGRRFVGGIAGANGTVTAGLADDLSKAKHTDVTGGGTISGWTNNGVVIGADDGIEAPAYIGGIVGVNAGTISGCAAKVQDVSANELFIGLGGANADFVGGIAGCNRGRLENGAVPVSGMVAGHDFVGGIVGCNDGELNEGTIEGYTTDGVSVTGNSFVGGIIGLNTSSVLLDKALSWNVGEVLGNSYVGGYAGANIVAASKAVTVTVDEAEGSAVSVTAQGAFAGGLFGYNRLVDKLDGIFDEGESKGIVRQLEAAGGADVDVQFRVSNVFDADNKYADNSSGNTMTLQDISLSGSVTGSVFAGGLLGYNAAQTSLIIKRCTGGASVTATGAVPAASLSSLAGKYGADKAYSFSGGITGYVTEKMTLDGCNFTGGTLTADSATYLGGLAEINEGTIIGCGAMTVGAAARNNVGGIVGINGYAAENPATLENSAGTGVSGNDVVGGAAAENYGKISGKDGISIRVSVTAGGTDVGGIVGINRGEIDGIAVGDIAVGDGSAIVGGNGRVGGIAGLNEGKITNCQPATNLSAGMAASLGGIAGVNNGPGTILLGVMESKSQVMNPPTNAAYVGGIAGENYGTISKTAEIVDCAQVSLSLSPNLNGVGGIEALGGIVGQNKGTIDSVEYTGNIKSGPGVKNEASYGGIAGINTENGLIEACRLGVAGEMSIEVNGSAYVGGAVGRNSGNAVIRNISTVPAAEEGSAIRVAVNTAGALATGGIVGVNEERAMVQDACSGSGWTIVANSTDGSVGGIIGLHTSTEGLLGLENRAGKVSLSVSGSTGGSEGDIIEESAPGGDTQTDSESRGAAGGIVGRVADGANTGSGITMQDCRNYGLVSAELPGGKAGGILGEWASNSSGNINGCINGSETGSGTGDGDAGDAVATVSAKSKASAAGIVGNFANAGGKVSILSCVNFGIIDNQYGAGIAAVAGEQPDGAASTVKIDNCANAGSINGGGAGIAVYDSVKSGTVSLKLDRCRNYGRPVEDSEDAERQFVGLVMDVQSGEFNVANKPTEGQITIENSIGVAEVMYPTVPMQEYTEDEKYKAEFKRISELYGATDDVYYYSAEQSQDQENWIPKLIRTAGAGFAVCYQNGLYQSPLEEEGGDTKTYLASVDEGDGSHYDPNSVAHKRDCRGNYNRLEVAFRSMCVELQKDTEVDPQKTPPATDVKAANNGGYLDITWKNGETEAETPSPDEPTDPGVETTKPGIVYKTIVELRLYESREAAKEDSEKEEAEWKTPVLTAKFYGGETSYTVRVSDSWLNRWIMVSVTNYSYSDKRQEEKSNTYIIRILPSLLAPEPVIRLEKDEAGNTVYKLDLLNRDKYTNDNNLLCFTVSAEEIREEGAQRTDSFTKQISLSSLPYALTPENIALGSEGGFFASSPDADVRLTFADLQMVPKGSAEGAGGEGTADGGNIQAEQNWAPSAKRTFRVVIPVGNRTFISEHQISRDGATVNYNLMGESATYRAELIMDVEQGDYLLQDIAVASLQQKIESDGSSLIVRLGVPAELMDGTARARVYPLEVQDGTIQFGYLVADGLTLDELRKSAYVEGGAAVVQTPAVGGSQISAAGDTQIMTLGETQAETTADQQQETAAQGETEQQSETEAAQEPQKTLTPLKAADGYSIERYGDNLFRVYCSALLSSGNRLYQESVIRWQEEKKPETMPTSTGGGGGTGTGARIGSVGGGTGTGAGAGQTQTEPPSESETESETKEETEPPTETEETETETETTETETETTETEPPTEPDLLPPESAVLYPNVEVAPLDEIEEDDTITATSEEYYLQNGVMLMVGSAANADAYEMRAAFYSEMGAGMEPDSSLLLTAMPDYDGTREIKMDDPMTGEYTFRNLPLSYAGKWLCVQFRSVSADGERSSEWSVYHWYQLPQIRLQAPQVTRGTVIQNDLLRTYAPTANPNGGETAESGTETTESETETAQSETEAVVAAETEVPLQHVAYSWTQTRQKEGEPLEVGQSAAGYLIELYRMLAADVTTDQSLYKEPTTVVNLMHRGDGDYCIEREYTEKEKTDWLAANPDKTLDDMPKYLSIPVELYVPNGMEDEQLKTELEDPNMKLYELTLNEAALGYDDPVSFTEDVSEHPELDKKEIAGLYARIRIREHLNSDTKEVESIDYQVILPDIEPQKDQTVLYTVSGAYCTHSVIVSQLLHSVFDENYAENNAESYAENYAENAGQQNSFVVADRERCTYLIETVTKDPQDPQNPREEGSESLLSYIRSLKPDRSFDDPFDSEKESPPEDPTKFSGYELLPRNYRVQLIRHEGDIEQIAAAMRVALQTDDPMTLNTIDNEMSFTLDLDGNMVLDEGETTVPGDTVPDQEDQDILPEEGGEMDWTDDGNTEWTDDGSSFGDVDVFVEPQTQAPTESQMQDPTESQVQDPTESQVQVPTESQTQAPTESQIQDLTESQIQDLTESQTQASTGSQTQAPTESQMQAPTEPQTQAPTESQTQAPIEPQTQAPTEPQTQAPIEPQTQAPTEPQTQAPTEPQTQAPTEPQTQAPAVEPVQELPEISITEAPAGAADSEAPEEVDLSIEAPVETDISLEASADTVVGSEIPAGEVVQ